MTTDDEPGARLAVVADHMDFVSETPTSIAADIRALTAERDAALRLAEERAGEIERLAPYEGRVFGLQNALDEIMRHPEGAALIARMALCSDSIAAGSIWPTLAAGGLPDSGGGF